MSVKYLRNRNSLILGLILLIAIINISIVFINFKAFDYIDKLHNNWSENTFSTLKRATYIAEIESAMGYGGLIHNFKNYILRRTADYESNINDNYDEIIINIKKLKSITQDQQSLKQISQIEMTVDEYWQRFNFVKNLNTEEYSVYALDKLVKVEDSKAIESLNTLKSSVLPAINKPLDYSKEQIKIIYELLLWGLLITVPMLLLATTGTSYALIRINKLLSELKVVLNASPDAIIYANSNGDILKSNRAAQKLFGYTRKEFVGLTIEDLLPNNIRNKHASFRESFNQSISSRSMGINGLSIHGVTKNNTEIPLDIAIASTNVGDEIHNVAVIRDISENLALERNANLDHLTSLKNRRAIDISLNSEISRAIRYQRHLALLLLDIDHFKELNDSEGHLAGDKALVMIAKTLSEKSRPSDSVGRWGGDEFMMICPELNQQDALVYANRLVDEIKELSIHGAVDITLSVGVSVIGECEINHSANEKKNKIDTSEKLISFADQALYEAKNNGRNQAVGSWELT